MLFNNIPPDLYCRNLVQTLRGENYDIFAKLPHSDTEQYHDLKNALLKKYELHSDNYKQRFRHSALKQGETFTQLLERLKSYLDEWIDLAPPFPYI